MPLIRNAAHIGGHDFAKVERAFICLGFVGPTRDTNDSAGAYVSNICDQYVADLTRDECRAIVTWGIDKPLAFFAGIQPGEYAVADVAGLHGD